MAQKWLADREERRVEERRVEGEKYQSAIRFYSHVPQVEDSSSDEEVLPKSREANNSSGFKLEHNTRILSLSDNSFSRNVAPASGDISSKFDFRSDSKLKSEECISNQTMMINDTNPNFIGSATDGVTNSVHNLNDDEIPKESVEEPKNDMVLKCKNCDDTQNCIISIACIGKSFCTNNEFEEESVRIYKNLADLHDKENHSVFHLPSIIVGMCKRISYLEDRLKRK